MITAVRDRLSTSFSYPGFSKEDIGEDMKEPKITAIVHWADSINSGLDTVQGGDIFYAWRIGEVTYYFNELDKIVTICNKTLETIEKITREKAIKQSR